MPSWKCKYVCLQGRGGERGSRRKQFLLSNMTLITTPFKNLRFSAERQSIALVKMSTCLKTYERIADYATNFDIGSGLTSHMGNYIIIELVQYLIIFKQIVTCQFLIICTVRILMNASS